MIFVLGGTGSWVGAIIFFGLLLLIGGYIAMIAAMCVVGPFLALHDWAIGKPGYQKFARHIPGYMDWIEKRLPAEAARGVRRMEARVRREDRLVRAQTFEPSPPGRGDPAMGAEAPAALQPG